MYLKYDVFKLIKIDYEYYKFKYSNNFFKMLQLQNKVWRMNILFVFITSFSYFVFLFLDFW